MRLVDSIDHPVDKLCIVQNGSDPDVVAAIDDLRINKRQWINSVYVERPFRNMGVSPAWNTIIKGFPECPYWLISNNDTLFLPGDLAKFNAAWQANQGAVITAPNGAFSCFAIGPEVVAKVGLFDENIWPIYSEDLDYIIRMRRENVSLIPLNSEIGEANNGSWTIRSSQSYRSANDITQARNGEYVSTKWGPNHDLEMPFGDLSRSNRDWWYDPYYRLEQSKAWEHMEATANKSTPVARKSVEKTLADIISSNGLVTDKNSLHSYCDHFYQKELEKYRNRTVQVVEIGIDQGGSLLLWAEHMPKARVLGIDLELRGDCERNCSRYDGRIQLALGNAYMLESLANFPEADIVIDDGPHTLESQMFAVKHILPKVRPGGLFVIEDIANRNWADLLLAEVPLHLRSSSEVIDLRDVKNRSDDIILVVRVPEGSPSTPEPVGIALLDDPIGLSMDMMAERLSHIKNIIDFNGVRNIIDVGAAHGYESKNLARVFTNAMVWAFEPTDEHYRYCLEHFASLPSDIRGRISIENLALNDIDGPIKFYPLDTERSHGNNTGMASKFRLIDPNVFRHELSIQREVTVNAITLATWCSRTGIKPDIIWMDAQGAELDILRGAGDVLEDVKIIMTEAALKPYYHGHTMKADIDKYLATFGFNELVLARKIGHEYEVDAIYVKGG